MSKKTILIVGTTLHDAESDLREKLVYLVATKENPIYLKKQRIIKTSKKTYVATSVNRLEQAVSGMEISGFWLTKALIREGVNVDEATSLCARRMNST